MRERLIELFKQADEKAGEYIRENDHMDFIPTKDELAGVYADHLLANGVIVPPCKVGQIVYFPIEDWDGEPFIDEVLIEGVCVHRGTWHITWGRDEHSPLSEAFLTREEAEKALKEVQGDG